MQSVNSICGQWAYLLMAVITDRPKGVSAVLRRRET